MENRKPDEKHAQPPALVKEGVVRPGHSPSVVSGQTADHVKRGQAYRRGEREIADPADIVLDGLD